MKKKFFVNSEEGIVRVTLTVDEGEFVGVATCSTEDEFDVARGLALAEKRALAQVKLADIKVFKDEVHSLEESIKPLAELLHNYRKSVRKLKAAKNCLKEIHKEIKELSI